MGPTRSWWDDATFHYSGGDGGSATADDRGQIASAPKSLVRRRPLWRLNRAKLQLAKRVGTALASVSSRLSAPSPRADPTAASASHSAVGAPAVAHIPESEAIARRLKDVPVYAVTLNDNFVFLQEEERRGSALPDSRRRDRSDAARPNSAAERSDPPREGERGSLLMLFMSPLGAQGFRDLVAGKQGGAGGARISTLFMDRVFRLHMQARPKELEGVALRLIPDRQQVAHARAAMGGVGGGALAGVPVFQAEGVTLRQGEQTFVPLFFGKEELDYAIQQAFGKRLVTPSVAYKREWFGRQRERVKEVAKSPFPFLYKAIWQRDDDKAKQHVKQLEQKQSALVQKRPDRIVPKVDVGSFEDVLFRMLYERGREFDNVVFVPQGVDFKNS